MTSSFDSPPTWRSRRRVSYYPPLVSLRHRQPLGLPTTFLTNDFNNNQLRLRISPTFQRGRQWDYDNNDPPSWPPWLSSSQHRCDLTIFIPDLMLRYLITCRIKKLYNDFITKAQIPNRFALRTSFFLICKVGNTFHSLVHFSNTNFLTAVIPTT